MARRFMTAAVLLAMLACACAQSWNADDARQLGAPGNNYCPALCAEAAKRNTSLAKLVDFCKSECEKCAVGVSKTTPGKKEPLPAPCQTAFRFKEVTAILSEYKAGKLIAEKSG